MPVPGVRSCSPGVAHEGLLDQFDHCCGESLAMAIPKGWWVKFGFGSRLDDWQQERNFSCWLSHSFVPKVGCLTHFQNLLAWGSFGLVSTYLHTYIWAGHNFQLTWAAIVSDFTSWQNTFPLHFPCLWNWRPTAEAHNISGEWLRNSTRDDTVSHRNIELFTSTGINMLIDVVVSYPKQLSSQNVVLACQIMYHVKCLIWNIRWPPVFGHVYRSDIMLSYA